MLYWLLSCELYYFFFFKQKTAYEMRISDWSSDVCSSDLASNLITLDDTGVLDAAGNTSLGSTDSNSYAIDTLRPTATIVVADTALAAGETSTVTITFNEAVSGLTTADFSVANGALSRSEEHTSELQSLMRTSYAVFCLKKKKKINITNKTY